MIRKDRITYQPVGARRAISLAVRYEVLRRGGFRCAYCGATTRETSLHIDHIVPVAKGGTNAIENLIPACGPCNIGKGINSAEPGGPRFEPVNLDDDPAWLGYDDFDADIDFAIEWDGVEPLL